MRSLSVGIALSLVVLSSAFAQNNRTFVSAGSGSDANPCSRTSPCRSFTAALAVTNASGEVIALDSGGYGPFTVTQAVSVISPPGVYAGVTVTSGNGITVNAGASDVVGLIGLAVEGTGTPFGIVFTGGSDLMIDRCTVIACGYGVYMTEPLNLSILNSSFFHCGIGVETVATTGTAHAVIDGCTFIRDYTGVFAGDRSIVLLSNSVIAGSMNTGAGAGALYGDDSTLVVEHCQLANNYESVSANSSAAGGVGTTYVAFSAITGSAVGLSQANSGVLYSRGNNTIVGNTNEKVGSIGSFSGQ